MANQHDNKTSEERFWEKVIKCENGCWNWTGSVSRGYGTLRVNGKTISAHRRSWIIVNGSIPEGVGFHGVCVLHTCDNRLCVNPSHLFLGTQADNINDMKQKGRRVSPRGEINGRSKLTQVEVIEIRRLASIVKRKEIADKYGVSIKTIGKIINKKLWEGGK